MRYKKQCAEARIILEMLDFKKYKRFFAFGCSMTSYYWPTWADIIAQEIPESYNYGQAGGGNLFIASQVAEANTRFKFNKDDLVIVMWSSISREDRYRHGAWITPGNIYTQNYFDEKFVQEWADSRGYLVRDLAVITMCKGLLDSVNTNYHMLCMAPFVDIQFNDPKKAFDDGVDVLNFYSDTVESLAPDLLTVACNGTWPQHPIRHKSGSQTADYHPSTEMYYRYLNEIFRGTQFSPTTVEFVKKFETIIKQSQYLEDFKYHWSKELPPRL